MLGTNPYTKCRGPNRSDLLSSTRKTRSRMTASEVGLDFDREESGSRHPRSGANVRRGPEIQDYTPF
ncbi:unnamed protein product [Ectocarpus sp. CCAP 1310/34]|nr:unnamed protein product [Ectocarpus sp. CCAP 1310/34]